MVFVIAEAGVNHQGDMSLAKRLIDTARDCGADAVKFQLFDPEVLEPPGARREMLKSLHIGWGGMRELQAHCRDVGIEFICTPFDPGSAQFLIDELEVRTVKIGSADLDNIDLLDAVSKGTHLVILSTGMATRPKIEAALARFWIQERLGPGLGLGVFLLHCVSAYPTPVMDMHLTAIADMLGEYDCSGVGLSDHSLSVIAPAVAVGIGASVIEKHLTLSRDMDGPDHKASLEPDEFRQMVANIREAELAIGTQGRDGPMPCETDVFEVAKERRAWRESLS